MKHLSISLNFHKLRPFALRDFAQRYPRDGRLTLYLLIVSFAVGIAGGALLIRADAQLAQSAAGWAQRYFAQRATGFWTVLLASYGRSLLCFAFAFFMGMFIPGCALAPALPLVRGVGYGMVCGVLYRGSVPDGVLDNLLAFLPSGCLATLVLLLGVREAIGFSASLLKTAIRGEAIALSAGFKLYCTRFLLLLGLLLFPALLDGCLARLIR